MKIPFLHPPEVNIWPVADDFRDKYAHGKVPVDILDIVEFELGIGIEALHGLRDENDVDALITSDFSTIFLDSHLLMDETYQNRLRFSVAHELGHLVLHKNFWKELKIKTVNDYVKFYDSLSDAEYSLLEYHASEFAGRLLVPLSELNDRLRIEMLKLPNNFPIREKADILFGYIAGPIGKYFGVSADVILKRLSKENIAL